MTDDHGTRQRYQQRCRCKACRAANTDYQREYERRRPSDYHHAAVFNETTWTRGELLQARADHPDPGRRAWPHSHNVGGAIPGGSADVNAEPNHDTEIKD